jgi:AraC-like DNA-binding protein
MIGPGMIRVSAAMPIPSVLGHFGIPLEPVLSDLGIRSDIFNDFENVIPYATLCRLASRCAALTKRDDFGLLVGQKGGFSSLGRVGFAAQHAPTVGAAVDSVGEYFQLHDRGATSALRVNGPLAVVNYRVYHPEIEGADQVGDGAVAISFLILQALCGPRWSATEVFFSRRKPANLKPYKEFFKSPLRFDCDSWGVSFPAAWLDHPVRQAEPVLRKLLVKDMQQLLAEAPDEFRDIVHRRVSETLSSGEFETEAIAEFLGISQRKLHRRLEAEGASFRAILRDARYGAARQLMGRTDLPVSEIAVMVGYSETSAFVRAFKRWSGVTPGSCRHRTSSDRDSRAAEVGMTV